MLKIEFSTDNDAFHDEFFTEDGTFNDYLKRKEVIRILDGISFCIKCNHNHGPIMDINGNKIGEWRVD